MARTLRNGFGPELNHIGSITGSTTFTLTNSPAPDQGNYFLKCTTNDAGTFFRNTGSNSITPKSFVWLVLRQYTLTYDSWGATGESAGIIGAGATNSVPSFLVAKKSGTIDYTVNIKGTGATIFATSESVYTSGTELTLLMEWNGTNIKVWINGRLEITYADTWQPLHDRIITSGNVNITTPVRLWRGAMLCDSNSESDRPGTLVEVIQMDPNANGTDAEWGSHTDCTASTSGDYTYWDDYTSGGTPNENTDYNCGEGNTDVEETSHLTAPSFTSGHTIDGVKYYCWAKANIADKFVPIYSRLRSSSSVSDISLGYLTTTAWVARREIYDTPPGGTTWASELAALEAGITRGSLADDEANIHVTALALEMFAVDNQPPRLFDEGLNINQSVKRGSFF